MRSTLPVLVGFCVGIVANSQVAASNPCSVSTPTFLGLETSIKQPGLSAASLADFRHRRGRLLAERGAYELALEDFAEALQHRSSMAEAYTSRGAALAHLGLQRQAVEAFGQALRLRPDEATTLIQRGELAYEQGQLASAIDDFDAALEIDPKNTNAIIGRANARRDQAWRSGHRRRQTLYQLALDDYAHAINLEPSNAGPYFHRAITYHRLDLFDKEAADWATAIGLDPNLFWQYGVIYRHRHIYEELRSDQRAAIQHPPDSAKAYFNRGDAYWYRGQHCRAIQDFDEAIRQRHGYINAHLRRGNAYLALGAIDEAVEDLSTVLRRKPNHVEALFYRSIAHTQAGDVAAAATDLRRAETLSPFNPVIQVHLLHLLD